MLAKVLVAQTPDVELAAENCLKEPEVHCIKEVEASISAAILFDGLDDLVERFDSCCRIVELRDEREISLVRRLLLFIGGSLFMGTKREDFAEFA